MDQVRSSLGLFAKFAYSCTIYYSTSQGHTRLGVAIGVPLGVILLVGLTAFVIVWRRRRRQTSLIQRSYVPPMSQQLPSRDDSSPTDIFTTTTTTTVPLSPSLAPSTALGSQSFSTPYSVVGSSVLGGVEVPPPYRSPDYTSRY